MSDSMGVNMERHAVLRLPDRVESLAMGEKWGEFMVQRTEAIWREEEDPLNFGWEPGIWKVVDALFGFPLWDVGFEKEIKYRFGEDKDWEWWSAEIRRVLGFRGPVRMVMINGGNRAGKTQYAAKRGVQILYSGRKKEVWCFHNTRPMSVQYQMPVVNGHLPAGKKFAQIQDGRPEYICYKTATGFSNDKFVNERGGTMMFKWYSSDPKDIEGGEIDFGWGDEHIDAARVDTLKMRVATRDGKLLLTFTPTEGYSDTVRLLHEGADKVRVDAAWLLPDDEGAALPWRALGFADEEEWERAKVLGPNSLPEDVHRWIEEGPQDAGLCAKESVKVGDRRFKLMPRVLRCMGTMMGGRISHEAAVVFFRSSDNPYGNPETVIRMCMGKSAAWVKERFYGLAEKSASARFPKFSERVHVLGRDSIPQGGTNYCLCDPSNGRNFVFLWARVIGEDVYFYREWPGNYPIEGVGLPGPWAELDGKKLDGRKGPAQSPFGFNLMRYKEELVRLEGWDVEGQGKDVKDWVPGPRSREMVVERYIDARAGAMAVTKADETSTLIDEMNRDLNMDWIPVNLVGNNSVLGDSSAVHLINDALYYDDDRPVDLTNRPRMYVCEDCVNLIFALKIWTGMDGNKGACKDFVDLVRYFFAQGLVDAGSGREMEVTGGGSW